MFKQTEPGERRHQVTILQQVISTDASGSVATWTAFLTTWAKIVPTKAVDVIRNGQIGSQTSLVLNIRYRPEIQANMRVEWTNGTYVIQGIENLEERNQELNLMCLALGANE